MSLTIENISRTGLGYLKIQMIKGKKTTATAWCSRYELRDTYLSILAIN